MSSRVDVDPEENSELVGPGRDAILLRLPMPVRNDVDDQVRQDASSVGLVYNVRR